MKKVVISQPMYFPWVGLLEQVRLADVFVHYDDVQFVKGFYNRVQVKTDRGAKWITVPLKDRHRGQKINEVKIDDSQDWRKRHYDILRQAYREAPYKDEMLSIVDEVFGIRAKSLVDISKASVMALVKYFELDKGCEFLGSSQLGVPGKSNQRLRDIVLHVGGHVYITGHGAKNYLDYELFERSGIEVRYMKYECKKYPQLYGPFTPYVTALDLVANFGKQGKEMIVSGTIPWMEFINGSY